MIKTALYRLMIEVIGRLPMPVLRTLGHGIGTLLWLLRTRMWLVTLENIRRCYPRMDERRQFLLARDSVRETGKTITETTYAWAQPVDKVLGAIQDVSGEAQVKQALAAGRGVIFVLPHLGNWEVINHYLGRHYGLTHMFAPNRNRRLNDFIQSRRHLTGTRFVPTDRSGIKAQLRILKSGGCIGVMPDQEPLIHTGEFVPFFGIEALTNELIAGMTKSGAAVFTAVCERTRAGFDIHFEPVAIDAIAPTRDKLITLNQAIEDTVRRRPAQYLWSYKRFRTRPEGKLDFYQFDRHPVRTSLETATLTLYLWFTPLLPRLFYPYLQAAIAPMLRQRRKISRINLALCKQPTALQSSGMKGLVECALEAPGIWQMSQQAFESRLSPDSDRLPAAPCIVLTPPLGSREALMRYLGNHHFATEYYHPNSITSLDRLIRRQRHQHGIALVEHDEFGEQHLIRQLQNQKVVTLCPDQQPRLRGGCFVPFFGHPALTTRVLPRLLRATGATLVLGQAIRQGSSFKLKFEPIVIDPQDSDEVILTVVNQQLEGAIDAHPEQYRWSDKRFNIQPLGQPKVYR